VRGRLQEQCRLADARLSAKQHERSWNDTTTEHAIEFVDAGREPYAGRRFNFCVQLCRAGTRKLRVAIVAGTGGRS
jgi:hypothetical protein